MRDEFVQSCTRDDHPLPVFGDGHIGQFGDGLAILAGPFIAQLALRIGHDGADQIARALIDFRGFFTFEHRVNQKQRVGRRSRLLGGQGLQDVAVTGVTDTDFFDGVADDGHFRCGVHAHGEGTDHFACRVAQRLLCQHVGVIVAYQQTCPGFAAFQGGDIGIGVIDGLADGRFAIDFQ